jgi:hypothetical protein
LTIVAACANSMLQTLRELVVYEKEITDKDGREGFGW